MRVDGATNIFSRISALLLFVVKFRKSQLNPGGDLAGGFHIHHRPSIHSRTVFCGFAALVGLGQQLRPVGKGTALQWLDRVHRAAVGKQERTLFMALLRKRNSGALPHR